MRREFYVLGTSDAWVDLGDVAQCYFSIKAENLSHHPFKPLPLSAKLEAVRATSSVRYCWFRRPCYDLLTCEDDLRISQQHCSTNSAKASGDFEAHRGASGHCAKIKIGATCGEYKRQPRGACTGDPSVIAFIYSA